ncbi:MAG: antibiotic biosynthesis monooxygenase [Acidobacteria bacterium]|nr:antibiotic biosynthesis monooxygenase [Acidobacteriota bacterium]
MSDSTKPIIKINAITVPEGMGDEVAQRFAERASAVDDQEGFIGFSLMRPTDERRTWLVVTEWETEEAFDAWVASPAFAHGHRAAVDESKSGETSAEKPAMGLSAELWSFEVALRSTGHGG